MLTDKTILDMCCGPRMFWFDKEDERAVFSDKRCESHTLCEMCIRDSRNILL